MLLDRSIRRPIGRGQPNADNDVLTVKQLFEQLDRLPRPDDGFDPFFDAPTEDTIRRYQKDRFLTIDGKMLPGGETERNLQRDLGLRPDEPPFSLSELDISGPVANGREGQAADYRGVSKALARLGLFEFDRTAEPLPFITRGLEDGIRKFQEREGLAVDGCILAGGETIAALKQATVQTMAADRATLPKGEAPRQKTPAAAAQAGGRNIEEERRALDKTWRAMERGAKEALTARKTPLSHDSMPQAELARRLRVDIRPEAIEEISKATRSDRARPTLNMEEARAWAILTGRDARFDIKDNPNVDPKAPLHHDHRKGVVAVKQYGKIIEKEATRYGLNPDLIKAVMYVENADGDPRGLNKMLEQIGVAKTILPMNINSRIWAGMGEVSEQEFHVPEKNIRAGAALIAAIRDRLDPQDRTPAKIGTIWHGLMRENTDEIGARIQKSFSEKSWTR